MSTVYMLAESNPFYGINFHGLDTVMIKKLCFFPESTLNFKLSRLRENILYRILVLTGLFI